MRVGLTFVVSSEINPLMCVVVVNVIAHDFPRAGRDATSCTLNVSGRRSLAVVGLPDFKGALRLEVDGTSNV